MNSQKKPCAGDLPDEIWTRILETGIKKSILYCTDLCSLSMSSKHFSELSNHDAIWKTLLLKHFPSESGPSSAPTYKLLYKSMIAKYVALIAQKEFHLLFLERRTGRIRREAELVDVETLPNSFLRQICHTTCRLKLEVVKLDRKFTEKEIAIMRAKVAYRNGDADPNIGLRDDAGADSN